MIPADQFFAFDNAAVECAAQDVLVVGNGLFTFADDVLQAQLSRIDTECIGQFVDDGFDEESALCRAIATESASRHFVGVDDFGGKPGVFELVVQGQRFLADQAEGGPAVQAVGTLVRKGIDGQGPDRAVTIGSDLDRGLHRMAAVRCHVGFLAGVDDLSRFAGFQGDDRRENFCDGSLLGAKTAADARLDDADPAGGQAKGQGELAFDVEGDLGRGNDDQAIPLVEVGIAAEGLHHRLGLGLGLVGPLQHNLAIVKDRCVARAEGVIVSPHDVMRDVGFADAVRQVEHHVI